MFTQFFYILKSRKVPVSITEWMTFMEALAKGYVTNLDEFYFLARAVLVKSEAHFDNYDVAFQEYFNGIAAPPEITEQIKAWLDDPYNEIARAEERQNLLDSLDFDALLRELEKRLREQTEQHDGGDYWIGRFGTSPFGHSGRNPAGIRIGGESGGRHAVQIAQQRLFQNYRHDLILDVRQIKMALKRLRQLNRDGFEEELDLEQTIDVTCKNAGEIELIWRRSRKNAVKVLLLMDVGGSMEPFAMMVSRLFSAAHSSTHFKDFRYYYFHNCIYDYLYEDIQRREAISTEHILRTFEPDYKLILVGDASMDVTELMSRYGAINYYERNETAGVAWLKRINEHFDRCIWLNPDNPRFWVHPTVSLIGKLFPMFPLTLDGLDQAVKSLVVRK